MHNVEGFDWSVGSSDEQLEKLRLVNEGQLCEIACACDWSVNSEAMLGWIMAQRCIDLSTALRVFMAARPARFNHLSKRNVSNEHLGRIRLLDNICMRINCGFYLPRRGVSAVSRRWVAQWIADQQEDQVRGLEGRWVLDKDILQTLLEDEVKLVLIEQGLPQSRFGQMRSLFMLPPRQPSQAMALSD